VVMCPWTPATARSPPHGLPDQEAPQAHAEEEAQEAAEEDALAASPARPLSGPAPSITRVTLAPPDSRNVSTLSSSRTRAATKPAVSGSATGNQYDEPLPATAASPPRRRRARPGTWPSGAPPARRPAPRSLTSTGTRCATAGAAAAVRAEPSVRSSASHAGTPPRSPARRAASRSRVEIAGELHGSSTSPRPRIITGRPSTHTGHVGASSAAAAITPAGSRA